MGEAIILISTGSISAFRPVLCVLHPVYCSKLVFLIAVLMERLVSNRSYFLFHFWSFNPNPRVEHPSAVKMRTIMYVFSIAKNIYIWNHVDGGCAYSQSFIAAIQSSNYIIERTNRRKLSHLHGKTWHDNASFITALLSICSDTPSN